MARRVKRIRGICGGTLALLLFIAIAGEAHSANGRSAPSAPAQSPLTNSASQASSQPNQPSGATSTTARKQKIFSSPEEAAEALYSAARKDDEKSMILILGPDANDVVVWTDNPEDRKSDIDVFVKKYEEMHRLVREPDDETTLYVGAENWPLPIPLVQKGGGWYFDCSLGKREILYRRIGENELETVNVLRALVDAENDYFTQTTDSDGAHQYARRLSSDGGMRDGLYWQTGAEADTSPVGPYVAQASFDRPDRKPFHGYYFRVLTEQGPKAPGGARQYIVNGKMTGGFAFFAFPADYRSSGVMTFIAGPNGVVYEKDLGSMTMQLAKAMATFNPDSTWTRVQ